MVHFYGSKYQHRDCTKGATDNTARTKQEFGKTKYVGTVASNGPILITTDDEKGVK